ncbi:carbohydrate-binding protein [Kitasatospora sp. NPDC051914]|uniref:carbohydrate-binding protein n=1 Tax=Kitasatospora sp. NPDC051914 TaxID=3154945 RepID=UPI0034252FFA
MRGYQLVSGASGVFRAEEARLHRGRTDTEHPGYSGAAYAVLEEGAGGQAEWEVEAAAPASATLALRYANGGTADRPMDIAVNGTRVVAARPFRPTGGWGSWATVSVPITLRTGANTVRVTAATAAGGPHLDRIAIS